jgi:signal transduction histidine kinase
MDNTLAKVSLEDLLQGTLQGLEEKVKESGAVAESSQLPVIEGYPLLLSLLFHHLLDNAIKFRQPDRSLKITVRAERVAKQDMPYHQITIADNGIGFDNSEAENIFNIFYRLHERHRYRGSGVGLAVCKKIMHLHGGYITAEGREGKGAVMCCLFPADA